MVTRKRHRPTKAELWLRREKVASLMPAMPSAYELLDAMKKDPAFKDQPIDIKDVYNDIEYFKAHAGEYISTRFLPELAMNFQNAVATLKVIVAEAWNKYESGETEVHHSVRQTEQGPMETMTTIKRQGSWQWLTLILNAQMAILKLGEQGIVIKEADRIMQEYKRLLDLEKQAKQKESGQS